jgi:hypothetical protein
MAPVHLLSAQILNLPKGVIVDRIGAVDMRFIRLPGVGDDPANMIISLPVNLVTISYSCITHDPLCTGWFIEARVHMTAAAPSTWKAGPARITYQVGDKTYWQDYSEFIGATTGSTDIPKL